MNVGQLLQVLDEVERRRRREAAQLREWVVRCCAGQDGSISSLSGGGVHDGGMALLIDVDEVADLLDVSTATVKRLARRGLIPALKVEGSTRYRRSDVEAYVASLEPAGTNLRPVAATTGG